MHVIGKQNIEATTNLTIKAYKAMNNWLQIENEAKACCESQAVGRSPTPTIVVKVFCTTTTN
jgi:hypothetical protein